MDTVTHSLLGAAVSDGWFRRRLGPAATPFALALSALPDIDSFTYLISIESAWMNHRGYTHSLLPMAVAAPVLGGVGYLVSRRRATWGLWTLLAALCLLLHTLLDLATSWGTMPFLPFSNARLSWDIAPIIDVFVLSLTLASFIANRLLRWERVDRFINPLTFPVVHRHPHRQRAGDWVGRIAGALVVVYLLVGWQQNRQTVRLAREALEKQGVAAVEVRALPVMFTYIAWGVAARGADGAVYNAVHSSYAPKPMRFIRFPTLPPEDADAIRAMREGGMFAWYCQNMFVAAREVVDGKTVTRLLDRRFFMLGRPEATRFEMLFDAASSGGVPGARMVWNAGGGIDVREEFRLLWQLMWDGDVAGWPGNFAAPPLQTPQNPK